MGWIKRNLFFVVVGVLALALLGGGGYYIYTGWARNSKASDSLTETYGTLKKLQQQKYLSGNDNVNNIAAAKEQQQAVEQWVRSARNYFQPIPPIPAGRVTSKSFAAALSTTVDQLQRQAGASGINLPEKSCFSFDVQSRELTIAPSSLVPLSVQLGEVKAIADAIFSARVNSLDGIQRVRVSADDATGPQGDYIDGQSVTNGLAVITPYVVTFRCFTPELARVISAFAASPNAFLVKAINVQPAGGATTPGDAPAAIELPRGAAAGKNGLQTVLKEQLLRVTLKLELVKLQAKS